MKKTTLINGSNNLPIFADIQYDENLGQRPVIIYAHGFCGFKDWANFDLVAEEFVKAGFTFLKFNFSHNGTTPETPETFTNLEAFGNNNYSLEIKDLHAVIEFLKNSENKFCQYIDATMIGLIGHSMGGGISILAAEQNAAVKALATWASISRCTTPWTSWSAQQLQEWQDTGVSFYHNGRTNQELPLYYQLYEDMEKNAEALDILAAAKKLKIPILICHGTEDKSVPLSAAEELVKASGGKLFTVESDHVFGRKHPATSPELPSATKEVVDATISFFKENLKAAN